MSHPALAILGVDPEFVLAAADEYSPSAAEALENGIRLFFRTSLQRDAAYDALTSSWPNATIVRLTVEDDGWAERSQENLPAVTVGGLIVVSAASFASPRSSSQPPHQTANDPGGTAHVLVIQPSTGFGTGHHASTRLCLEALQTLNLHDRTVLDVGTGSGILAIAAGILGASSSVGIDDDPDAVRAARENLSLNPTARGVRIDELDITRGGLPPADVVLANLTGALLQRAARVLLTSTTSGGHLVVSGVLKEEREAVIGAFAGATLVWEGSEDEWIGMIFRTTKKSL